ncbi:MAG: hypothetical protein EZS28_039007, partial [Streblomastix strix]
GGIERNDENQQLKKELLESERKRIEAEDKLKQSGQETEDLLRSINGIYDSPELKQSDWFEMKNELEIVERGTEIQKEEIRQKKIKTCQKIISIFIGKENNEGKKLTIESGAIDALLHLLIEYPLDKITISHIWALYIFTYSSDEITLLLVSRNPFQSLLHLFDHPNMFVVNRAVVSIYNILISGSNTIVSSEPHPQFTVIQALDGIQNLYALFLKNVSQFSKNVSAESIAQLYKAMELPNEMKKEIINHLKSIFTRSEDDEKKDDEIRLRIINSGIVDALLHLFLTRDLNTITRAFSQAFFVLTYPLSNEITLSLFEIHPYPALIRLLNHSNKQIVDDLIASIYNIVIFGTDTPSISEKHPHFAEIQSCDGIRKLFDLFKRNDISKFNKDTTAECIGKLFRAQEIPDKQMRTKIIAHLKALLNSFDDWEKIIAKKALKGLSQNAVNRTEIEKDGFVIPQ